MTDQAPALDLSKYYEEHKAEIDAQEAAYQAELDEAQKRYSENSNQVDFGINSESRFLA